MSNADDGVLALPSDLPRGEVTGGGSGALGPWRAHQAIDAMARQIAEGVQARLGSAAANARVLVVSDRDVRTGDWTARYVCESLDRLAKRAGDLCGDLDAGQSELGQARIDWPAEDEQDAEDAEDADQRRGSASAPPSAGVIPPGTFGTAVELLGLVRTDYTLTASTVTPGPSELATLTAAQLVRQQVAAESDVFATAATSPILDRLGTLLDARDGAVKALCLLQQQLAPAESELAALAASGERLERAWAGAAAGAAHGDPGEQGGAGDMDDPESSGDADDADGSAENGEYTANGDDDGDTENGEDGEGPQLATPRRAADTIARMAARRERAVAPARVLNDYARLVLAEVDAGIGALTKGADGSTAPVHAALRWERLRNEAGTAGAITHVLHVGLDSIAADVVTRRSVLGMSGLLRVLAAGNASWSLLEVAADGKIMAGGHVNYAGLTSFSLGNGKSSHTEIPAQPGNPSRLRDPARVAEVAAKALVIVLALVLAALGVLSVLAVIRVAVR